jgi:hypothetical protein
MSETIHIIANNRTYSLPWNRTEFFTLKSIIEALEPNYTETAPFTAPDKVSTVGGFDASAGWHSISWDDGYGEWMTDDCTLNNEYGVQIISDTAIDWAIEIAAPSPKVTALAATIYREG